MVTLDDWLAGGLSGRSDGTRELYRDTVKPAGSADEVAQVIMFLASPAASYLTGS